MAYRKNGIWYEGRIVNNRDQCKLSRSKAGNLVLDLVISEQFTQKNSQAPDEFKDATKAADDYVNTYTAWHKIRVFADAKDESFLALVRNPLFAHGAVLEIDVKYEETKPWTDRGNIVHAGRQEQVFWGKEDSGTIAIKVTPSGTTLGARDENQRPFLTGTIDSLPALGGSGGGAPAAPEYRDDEGF